MDDLPLIPPPVPATPQPRNSVPLPGLPVGPVVDPLAERL